VQPPRLPKNTSLAKNSRNRAHQNDAGYEQPAGHDCVLNADNDPSHKRVATEGSLSFAELAGTSAHTIEIALGEYVWDPRLSFDRFRTSVDDSGTGNHNQAQDEAGVCHRSIPPSTA
jgi:hypothetical protein